MQFQRKLNFGKFFGSNFFSKYHFSTIKKIIFLGKKLFLVDKKWFKNNVKNKFFSHSDFLRPGATAPTNRSTQKQADSIDPVPWTEATISLLIRGLQRNSNVWCQPFRCQQTLLIRWALVAMPALLICGEAIAHHLISCPGLKLLEYQCEKRSLQFLGLYCSQSHHTDAERAERHQFPAWQRACTSRHRWTNS